MEKQKIFKKIAIEYGIFQRIPKEKNSSKKPSSFIVSVWFNKKPHHAGTFTNIEAARLARDKKMRELGTKARLYVKGVENLPDDLKMLPFKVKKKAVPNAVKIGFEIESLSQKFSRQLAEKKEAALIDFMRDDTIARNYHPNRYRDDGKDYTPVYKYRGKAE